MKPDCENCPLAEYGLSQGCRDSVPSTIRPYAPVAFVGMAPGKTEVERQEVFTGKAGKVLNLGLEDHGIDRERDCSLINLLLCKIPENDWKKAGPKAVKACAPRFWGELAKAAPKLVVTLGAEPLRALDPTTRGKGLFYWRGVVREISVPSLSSGPLRLLPTYHPAALLYDPEPAKLGYFHRDLEEINVLGKAWQLESQGNRRKKRRTTDGEYVRPSGGRRRSRQTPEDAGIVQAQEVAISRQALPASIQGAVLDIETSVLEESVEGDRIRCIGITPYARSVRGGRVRKTHSRRHRVWQVSTDDVRRRVEVLESICGHNITYDFCHLVRSGAIPRDWEGILDDTMVLSSLVNENREEQGLKTWAQEFGYGLYWERVFEYWKRREDPPRDLLLRYNARDVALTGDLYQHLREQLQVDEHLTRYYDRFVTKAIRLSAELQLNGIYVCDTVEDEIGKVKRRLTYRRKKILDAVGETDDVNINGSLWKRDVLFGKLGLPRLQLTTKTRLPSLSRSHLEKLLPHDKSGVVQRYLELSFIQKQLSDLEQLRDHAGRLIHPTYNVGGTGEKDAERRPVRTGRWSCQNPNVQQFAHYLKRHVGSRHHRGYIVQWDGDQIECRVAATYSGDPVLEALFRDGSDPYIDCAEAIFGRDRAAARRFMGKRSLLAAIYGVREDFLSESLNKDLANRGFKERVSPDDCREFLQSIYQRYSRHYEWIGDVKATARREGEVRSLTGRVRHLPLARRGDWHALNQAVNYPIQSLANDLNLLAAITLGPRFPGGLLMALVHDSGVADVDSMRTVRWFARKVNNIWKNLPTEEYFGFKLSVPLTITVSYGERWHPLEEIAA